MASTLVYFVRHGQTSDNVLGIIQGQKDTALDETGVRQASDVAEALKNVKFDLAFTSDLIRAVDTANAILDYHPTVNLTKLEVLRERYMGTLQGETFRKGMRLVNESVEKDAVFTQRTMHFWDEILLPSVQKIRRDTPSNILVVSHGGFISTFVRAAMNNKGVVPASGVKINWCPNISLTTIEVRHDGSSVLHSFGDVSHVPERESVIVGNVDELKTVNGLYHGGN
ncbi:phosphoglycerate mutase-like protein [Hysterangium stoloniferum]|nr:phosphoglycerate mutase-like protein [Hysterangium stoloniferum]